MQQDQILIKVKYVMWTERLDFDLHSPRPIYPKLEYVRHSVEGAHRIQQIHCLV